MRSDLLHHYRIARAQQLATYGNSGLHVAGVDQRQYTGGGAWYGHHALAAFDYARRQIHFRKYLAEVVAEGKKRSKAAKRGWRTRRAAA